MPREIGPPAGDADAIAPFRQRPYEVAADEAGATDQRDERL
jgi:hypothetical protein